MSVEDARHALEIENSENECRKPFTMRERYEMFLRRYEFLKANPEFRNSKMSPSTQAKEDVGIGSNTIKCIREIAAHESELDPQDIADHDRHNHGPVGNCQQGPSEAGTACKTGYRHHAQVTADWVPVTMQKGIPPCQIDTGGVTD